MNVTSIADLEQLVRECTVHVRGEKPGTGFFVAPGVVLTCAHVIGDHQQVDVKWDAAPEGQPDTLETSGIVLHTGSSQPFPALDENYPDLAVIKVDGWEGHPCVLLDTDHEPSNEETFFVYGYPEEGGAIRQTPSGLTFTGINGGDTPTPLLDFQEGKAEAGFSGAALVSKKPLSVCGVLIAGRSNTKLNGGLGVPISAVTDQIGDVIESNRVFHDGDDRWSVASGGLHRDRSRVREVMVRLTAGDGGYVIEVHIDGSCVDRRERVQVDAVLESATEFLKDQFLGITSDPTPELAALRSKRMASLGHQLGQLLFGVAAAEEVQGLIGGLVGGDSLDVIVEAPVKLMGLPFEAVQIDSTPLVLCPGVRFARRVLGSEKKPSVGLAGPLKILVAVGAPDEAQTPAMPLEVEREWEQVLSVLDRARDRVQVTFLESTTPADIGAALTRDQYHVLHLSGHGSPGLIELANEDGRAVSVDATDLRDVIVESGRRLPLVVLSSCYSGVPPVDDTAALPVGLLNAGVDYVVAMQTAVSDDFATEFAAALYKRLATTADCHLGVGIAGALNSTESQRADRAAAESRPHFSAFAAVSLYCATDGGQILDSGAETVPLKPQAPARKGGVIAELGLHELIGRRTLVRDTYRPLTGHEASLEAHGAVGGVVLTSIGGGGKTAIAGRVVSRLRAEGWPVAGLTGQFSVRALAESVAKALPHYSDTVSALSDEQLVELLAQIVNDERLVVVLDDFEANLVTGSGDFIDDTSQQILDGLAQRARNTRFLITSRHMPHEIGGLLEIPVGPLTPFESARMARRLRGLNKLASQELHQLIAAIGGHPRMLEFVDAALRGGRSDNRDLTARIAALTSNQPIDFTGNSPEAATRAGIELAVRDIVLTELLDTLTPTEQTVLGQAAVSNLPFDRTFLYRCLPDTTPGDIDNAVDALTTASLVTPTADDTWWVHRWTAEGIRELADPQTHQRYCRTAAQTRIQPGPEGINIDDAEEAVRLLLTAGDHNEAIELAISVLGFLQANHQTLRVISLASETLAATGLEPADARIIGQIEADTNILLGRLTHATQRWEQLAAHNQRKTAADPTNTQWQRDLTISHNNLGDLAKATGNLDQANTHYQHALNIAEQLAAADPTNTQWQRDLTISHNNLGDLAKATGNLDQANTHYQHALNIAEQLAAADPTNTEWQRDLTISHNNLGDLAKATGNLDQANTHYQHDLNIAEQLAAADPTNTEWQRDLTISHTNLGDLAKATGNLDQANTHYQHALNIAEQLAAADPTNTEWQRDLSVTHTNLGDLARATGNLDQANTHYQHALNIAEQLAAADPTNTQWQRDLTISHNNLGDLAKATGNLDQANTHYQHALNIAEQLAAADPTNTEWQRDLTISHNNLGDLAKATGNLDQANTHYQHDLNIAEQLAAADPTNTEWQRDLTISHTNLGDLAKATGNLDQANTHYQHALNIAEQLAAADPTNTEWQRDLSVTHTNLGDLARATGNLDQANTHYQHALNIAEQLAAADPTNTEWQRDLTVSHNNLGDLAKATGNLDQANTHYQHALNIAEQLAAADPTNTQWQRDLTISHNNLGDLAKATGNLDQANTHYQHALNIREQLAAADPTNTEWQRDLTVTHTNLGDLAKATGNLDQANTHYQHALNIAEQLAAADPTNTEWQRDLTISHNNLGDLAKATGNLDQANTHYQHALNIREQLAAADPTNTQWQRDLTVTHTNLGDLAKATGNLDQANTHYQHALNIAEQLAAADPTNTEWQRDLTVSHNNLGDLAKATGNLDQANTHYQHALNIREQLAAADPTNTQWQRDLTISHNNLGDLAKATGNLDQANTHYQHALNIREQLAAADPTNTQWQRDLTVTHTNLGDLAKATGNLDQANTHYQHALNIAERVDDVQLAVATSLRLVELAHEEQLLEPPSRSVTQALGVLADLASAIGEAAFIKILDNNLAPTAIGPVTDAISRTNAAGNPPDSTD